MPTETEVQRRDRALIAFTALTGMRDAAIASIRLKHINLSKDPVLIRQEPDQVKTKFSKTIFSHFLPVGDDLKTVVLNWVTELRAKKCYGQNEPLFPRTHLVHDENHAFTSGGLEPICWSTASPIRKIFKEAFLSANLPYYSPHRFRDTLVHFGQDICKTPEQFKAWSQSLGHSSPLTTFISYGTLDPHRQGEVLKHLNPDGLNASENETLKRVLKLIGSNKLQLLDDK